MHGITIAALDRATELARSTILFDALENERANNQLLRSRIARLVHIINEKEATK